MITVSDLNESHLNLARITDALFCSGLKTGSSPTGQQLADAIRETFKKYRTWNGLTREVSGAFALVPVDAERREAWCQQLAEHALNNKDLVLNPDDLLI